MTTSFAARVRERVAAVGNPILVGLDPVLKRLPEELRAVGESDLESAAASFYWFGKEIIGAVADRVVGIKPQAACYERLGVAGYWALAETIRLARETGLLVVLDAKRGDIAKTMAAYADGHLGRVAVRGGEVAVLDADALTVSAFLGRDSLEPLVDVCRDRGKGLFVLVRTSNPGAADVQALELADGRTVSDAVADLLTAFADEHFPLEAGERYGPVGAVVAGNLVDRELAARLRERLPRSIILAPGYGAQGGTAEALAPLFDAEGGGVLVPASSWLTYAYERREHRALGPSGFAAACRAAAEEMATDLSRR